ncbi:putative transcriptional regulator [Magnetococcus marinus MC-1]|uniref:Putative transcriptional regulator n=1 Tax=Magnetococcus marinus (strain ATCC BAA-1437 / JCM 17883 / MC-1) TaxID=156889 RepID=A0LCT4_MAGMM|nr:putative transcriptional regulator [Magnetococcus marinus MC-1]
MSPELLRQNGPASLAQLKAELQAPKTTIYRNLNKMITEGRVWRNLISGDVTFSTEKVVPKVGSLTPRQKQAVAMAQAMERISRLELSKELGISPRTASRELATLVAFKILELDGKRGRHAAYRLCHTNHKCD